MGSPTEIYVDPSIAGDSGAGTSGDQYGDLEYAIEQTTFDTTDGTRVNIKAGTDEILAADLSTAFADTGTTVAWVPSATAPAIFQGYTSAAGDGGPGGISGGGSVSIFDAGTQNSIHFFDMHLHNTGSAKTTNLNDQCWFVNCEISDADSAGIDVDNDVFVLGCYFHDIGARALECQQDATVMNCYFKDVLYGVKCSSEGVVLGNIISLGATVGDGIQVTDRALVTGSR